ncbi:hypothetical protein HK405_007185 [Cladochytrium tenue]|nr:hypothetical protein HK405_007185 [Cladochytrium tenue]
MKVLVIGGGIAGPALALGLKRSGHDVKLFDRMPAPIPAALTTDNDGAASATAWVPPESGGAILTNENVLRVFKHLGVLDDVMAAGTQVVQHHLSRFDGRPFAVFNTFDGKEFVTTGVLRSDIANPIYKALSALGVTLQPNKKLVKIDQPTDGSLGVTAYFEDGTSASGDILVGADGINSTVRSLLFPDVKVKTSQYCGYFAVSPLNGAPSPTNFRVMSEMQTGNSAFVMPSGDKMVHWGLFESRPEANDNSSWDLSGDLTVERDNMLTLTKKWNLTKEFKDLAQTTDRVIRVNFSAVPPLPTWHSHNCVLIGDAAHALYPFIGQGAGMSLEDAVVLPILLDRFPQQPATAFQFLHELRAPRVGKVAAMSEALGSRGSGTSPATAAIGQFILKLFSYYARLFRTSFFNDEIVRYDCCEAAVKFLESKGLPKA